MSEARSYPRSMICNGSVIEFRHMTPADEPTVLDFARKLPVHDFSSFMDAANKSVAMIPNPTTEISKKTLSFTEKNMKAAFDHARSLVHAKDAQEAMQIQTEFLKGQFAAASEQLKELGSGVLSAAKDVSQNKDNKS